MVATRKLIRRRTLSPNVRRRGFVDTLSDVAPSGPSSARGVDLPAIVVVLLSIPFTIGVAPAPETRPASVRPDIRVLGDNWHASTADVEKVLSSTAWQVMAYVPGRELKPILVTHWNQVPMTLDAKGPHGEIQIRLPASSTYWAQYTYEFAHELCHVLCNYDRRRRGRNLWFEEALCETSSLFVLSKMHHAWETDPPYPNWKDWGIHFDEYADHLLAEPSRRLPPDRVMATWLDLKIRTLEQDTGLTEHSKLVAAYLLPIFQDRPEGWEALNGINLGEKDDSVDFQHYLQGWHERVPERHKAFVAKVAKLFGHDVE